MPTDPPPASTPDDQATRLSAVVQAAYGLELADLVLVTGGADTRATTWQGRAGAGTYAVRLSSHAGAVGAEVLDVLAQHEVPGVVRPVRTLDGRVSTTLAGARVTVLPWVVGTVDTAASLSRDQWSALGRLLRRVHRTDPGPLRSVLPVDRFELGWYDDVLAEVGRGLAVPTDPIDPIDPIGPITVELASCWTAAQPRIDAVLMTLHRLADRLRNTPVDGLPPAPVLCHADPHLGNVVVDRDGEVWLIDWDDAVLGAPERDLMFVLGGVIAAAPIRAPHRDWFFTGYGDVRIDPDLITWYRGLRAIEDLALPAREILRGDRAPAELAGQLRIIRGGLGETGLVAQTLGETT